MIDLKVELGNDQKCSRSTRDDTKPSSRCVAARRGNSGDFRLPSDSTVRTVEAIVSLYIQDTAQKRESRDHTRFKNVVGPDIWDRKNREKHFSSRERQLDKPASGAAAAKEQV